MCLRTGELRVEEGLRGGLVSAQERSFAEPGAGPRFAPDNELVLHGINVTLRIDPEAGTLHGSSLLDIGPRPTGFGRVRLHLDEVELESVSADVPGFSYTYGDGILELRGLTERSVVKVVWSARPRRGLYFIAPDQSRPTRGFQVWSQGQDEDSHFYMPCFDHPSVRHPWLVRVEAPSRYTAISNGVLQSLEPAGEDWTAWTWRQDDPIPAYLVTVAVSEFTVVEDQAGGLPLRYLGPVTASEATLRRVFGKTPQMVACFEQRFGVPFNWPRYDQVVVEDFIFGGMENAGATTLTDLCITDEQAGKVIDHEALIAHELAHQWFGDLVTCRDWSQAWLNEGWATFSEQLWFEHSRGEAYGAWYGWTHAEEYFEEAEGRYKRPIVSNRFREPIDVFDRHLYEKGACVLRTLRAELGPERFWAGVQSYLQNRRLSGVHTLLFQDSLSEQSGRSLEGFFQQWVHQPGHPVVSVKLAHEDGLLQVEVEQKQTGEGVPEAYQFTLRLVLVTAAGEQVVDLPVRTRSRAFVLPCADAPLRVQVDPGFRVLAQLSVEAPGSWLRATLRDDSCPVGRIRAARALARSGEPSGIAALSQALRSDRDWFVRAELASILGRVRGPVVRDALLQALREETELRVRRPLVTALGELRGEPGVEDTLRAVADADPSLTAQAEAAKSLGRLRSPFAREVQERALSRESWADMLRIQALAGLGATQDPLALPLLLEHTQARFSPRVQASAATALGQLSDELPEARRPAVDRLIELAEGGQFRLQMASVAALARANDPRALGVLTRLHQQAPDGRVRRAAYEALADLRAGSDGDQALSRLRSTLDELRSAHTELRGRVDRLTPKDDA